MRCERGACAGAHVVSLLLLAFPERYPRLKELIEILISGNNHHLRTHT